MDKEGALIKLIAVSLSNECIGDCSFCLRNKKDIKTEEMDKWDLYNKLIEITDNNPNCTICFEYGGYGLSKIVDGYTLSVDIIKTITTMPAGVTPIFAGMIKSIGISGVALSYDDEKCSSPQEWVDKANILKDAGLPTSCNYLMTQNVPTIPDDLIMENSDQINLLCLKPNGQLSINKLNEIAKFILTKPMNIALDNCLAVQLGFKKECGAGTEFIHIMPDGTILDCCFGDECYLHKSGSQIYNSSK